MQKCSASNIIQECTKHIRLLSTKSFSRGPGDRVKQHPLTFNEQFLIYGKVISRRRLGV